MKMKNTIKYKISTPFFNTEVLGCDFDVINGTTVIFAYDNDGNLFEAAVVGSIAVIEIIHTLSSFSGSIPEVEQNSIKYKIHTPFFDTEILGCDLVVLQGTTIIYANDGEDDTREVLAIGSIAVIEAIHLS